MKIRNVLHKGLRLLIERDDIRGVPANQADKLRTMISFLQAMSHEDELLAFPHWGAHRLTGARRGVWSLVVGRNWRLTFRIDSGELEILDLNYEDYH